METTPELIIFLIVGAVAILAAVMMLISENAVHAALFLILNFACVAFLFLMLNAAFLAMVQVTVYAGAIMVLFMFVIMLLGAERLAPEESPRFPWLTPVAIVLTAVFLVVAGWGVLSSEISTAEPEPLAPLVRVINTVPEYKAVDVWLNGELLAEDVGFREISDLVEWPDGTAEISIVAHNEAGEEAEVTPALLSFNDPNSTMDIMQLVDAELEGETHPAVLEVTEPSLELAENTDVTLVLTSTAEGGVGIIPVYENFNTVEDRKSARVQVVHADPAGGVVEFANVSDADNAPEVLFDGLEFGEVSPAHIIRSGDTRYGLYENGAVEVAVAADEDAAVNDVPAINLHSEDAFEPNSSNLYVIAPPLNPDLPGRVTELDAYRIVNRPVFGGPESVGQLLFTTYMLPFQIIAALLLVAMIGAIVLTRDQVPPPRKRFPRRLANESGNPIVEE
jgi:NADH:ubiquinone oxidoreductase subunit 6 (subunit J)